MKTRRLIEVLNYLVKHPGSTAGTIAKQFEVSKRTILRDMDDLLVAGYPIVVSKGRYGGYSLDPDFVLPPAILTQSDKSILSSLVDTLSLIPLSSSLQQMLGGESWFEYDFSSWVHSDSTLFENIRTAIILQQEIHFIYTNAKGKTAPRTVRPQKLIYKDRFWYLKAMDCMKQEERLYKLKRIRREEVDSEIPAGWICVDLVIRSSQVYRIYEECRVLRYERETRLPDYDMAAWSELSFSCPNTAWVSDFILSFGEAAVVLEPKVLREELRQRVMKMHAAYTDSLF